MSALVSTLIKHWPFARAMAVRELSASTKGFVLGIAWTVVRPLIQVVVYVAIVTFVFGARLNPTAGPFDYALFVLAGLFGWQILQRALEEASSLIRDRMDILKQVVYPIETLPVTSFFVSSIAPAVLLAVYVVLAGVSGKLNWTIVLVPIPIAMLLALLLGLSWIFMVVGVVLKDLKEIVSVLLGMMIYFSPVLLSPTMVPPRVWTAIMLNPVSHIILAFRDVFQATFHPVSWAIFAGLIVVALAVGAAVITRARVTINEYI